MIQQSPCVSRSARSLFVTARGCVTILIAVLGMWYLTSTAQADQSPTKPNDRTADKASSISNAADKTPSCPALTRIRFYPRKGFAQRMLQGRFSGSNESKTADAETIVQIKEVPAEGQWTEMQLTKPVRFRYLKYESPLGSWGNVAEVEFYSDEKKIQGQPFGTPGSRGESGNDFSKALDGSVETSFDGTVAHGQYVGIDLGPEVQAAAPQSSVQQGVYATPQEIAITSATPGAKIRITRDWGTPRRDWGPIYNGPIKAEKSTYLVRWSTEFRFLSRWP